MKLNSLAAAALGLLGVCVQHPADADQSSSWPTKSYILKEEEPQIGTSIRRERVRGDVPFDKRYSELSPAEKRLFKSQYEGMKESDEPPFPAAGLGPLYRKISVLQDRLRLKGALDMDVEVDAEGNARSVKVFKSPSSEATQVAAGVLMLEKYKPAICDGKPC